MLNTLIIMFIIVTMIKEQHTIEKLLQNIDHSLTTFVLNNCCSPVVKISAQNEENVLIDINGEFE